MFMLTLITNYDQNYRKKGLKFCKDRFDRALELRQFKNDSTQSKNFLVLKLPPLFIHNIGDEKAW